MKLRRVFAAVIAFLLAVSALGCGPRKSPGNVIFPDNEVRDYITRARAGEKDLDKLYRDTVISPVSDMLVALSMSEMGFLPTIKNLAELDKYLLALDKADVRGLVDSALNRANDYIKSNAVKAYIFPADPDDATTKYFRKGVRGFPIAPLSFFFIEVNPSAEQWEESLQYRTAYLYYGVLEGYGENTATLLDYLLDEGRAASFAAMNYPQYQDPYISNVSPTELKLIKDNLHSSDYDSFMFWDYSYTIGYTIFQEFLNNNPDVTVEDWADIPSQEILEKSEFDWEVSS